MFKNETNMDLGIEKCRKLYQRLKGEEKKVKLADDFFYLTKNFRSMTWRSTGSTTRSVLGQVEELDQWLH